MLVEQKINDFLHVCGRLYNFFASPLLHFAVMVKVETPAYAEMDWTSGLQ